MWPVQDELHPWGRDRPWSSANQVFHTLVIVTGSGKRTGSSWRQCVGKHVWPSRRVILSFSSEAAAERWPPPLDGVRELHSPGGAIVTVGPWEESLELWAKDKVMGSLTQRMREMRPWAANVQVQNQVFPKYELTHSLYYLGQFMSQSPAQRRILTKN